MWCATYYLIDLYREFGWDCYVHDMGTLTEVEYVDPAAVLSAYLFPSLYRHQLYVIDRTK